MNASEFVVAASHFGTGNRTDAPPALDSPELWPNVVELAIEHRVAPLLREGLARRQAWSAPEQVLAALEAQLLRGSATRLLCESTLAELLHVLRGQGVEVIVLKGASVAHEVYPRPELRIYHDLDVLCRVSDYRVVHGALSASGYTSAGTLEKIGTHSVLAEKPSPYESHAVRGFYDPSGDIKVEVHFDMLQLGPRNRGEHELWRTSRTRDIGGTEIRVLSPEYQLLHLSAHAHRHCYSRLSWLIELDALVRRQRRSLDWSLLMRIAREEGVGSVLRHALATTHAVFDTPLPELPRATFEERCLGICYRSLWPFARARGLNQHEHHRLLHFLPDDADARNVLYGLVLVGRRRDKLQALLRRWAPEH